jgi:hypothetical protein
MHPRSNHASASQIDPVLDELEKLFTAFPSDRGTGTAFAATYLIALEGYSLEAIQTAVKKIIRGEADDLDKRFLPTPAQLGNIVARWEKALAPPAPKALPAPEQWRDESPDAQARRQAVVDRYYASIPPATAANAVSIVEDFDAWEARMAAEAQEGNKLGRWRLSEAAAAIMARVEPLSDKALEMLAEHQGKTAKAGAKPIGSIIKRQGEAA